MQCRVSRRCGCCKAEWRFCGAASPRWLLASWLRSVEGVKPLGSRRDAAAGRRSRLRSFCVSRVPSPALRSAFPAVSIVSAFMAEFPHLECSGVTLSCRLECSGTITRLIATSTFWPKQSSHLSLLSSWDYRLGDPRRRSHPGHQRDSFGQRGASRCGVYGTGCPEPGPIPIRRTAIGSAESKHS
ncbi:hypothetical protein AAY473_017555 [Plecturocebus cupreus]